MNGSPGSGRAPGRGHRPRAHGTVFGIFGGGARRAPNALARVAQSSCAEFATVCIRYYMVRCAHVRVVISNGGPDRQEPGPDPQHQ
jgi:hypothetical protein